MGLQNPGVVNAPGGGVTEEADLVRTKFRDVLSALEVDSGEIEGRGYQQGFAIPTTVNRRRIALGSMLRAGFLSLWTRATGMLAVTGRPQLHDDDKGCSVGVMPLIYPPPASPRSTRHSIVRLSPC